MPVPDQPSLGILRLSPTKARELNLSQDQVIRGIVTEDGESVEISVGNVKQEIRAQLEQWKGKLIELKINIDSRGSKSSEAEAKSDISGPSNQSWSSNKSNPLHPKLLMTLLSNPTFYSLKLHGKGQLNSAAEWLNSLGPSSTNIMSPFLSSIKKIDEFIVRKQLRSNGFKRRSDNLSSAKSMVTIRNALAVVLKNLEESPSQVDGNLTADQLNRFVDYLDANLIEYTLKQEEREIGVRFIMLFSDFPAAEIYIHGENTDPKRQDKHKWSIEVSLTLSEGNEIWGKVEQVKHRVMAAEFLFSNNRTKELAKSNIGHLRELFNSAGMQLVRCDLANGSNSGVERKEILKERGNMELSV